MRLHILRPRICSEDGKFTLEAAIIMPVIIAITVLLTYMGTILYQYCLVSSVVDYAAKRVSEIWDNWPAGSGGGNSSGLFSDSGYAVAKDLPLYRRLAAYDSDRKEEESAGFILSEIEKRGLFKKSNASVTVRMTDCILYRKVTATAEVTYETPVRKFTVVASSESIIKDPAELIRNTDFVFNLKKEIEGKIPGGKNGVEKMGTVVKEIWDAIKNMFQGGG